MSQNERSKGRIVMICTINEYALNKILISHWSNIDLRLDDVWLVGSSVRLVANSKEVYIGNVMNVGSVANNIMQFDSNVRTLE